MHASVILRELSGGLGFSHGLSNSQARSPGVISKNPGDYAGLYTAMQQVHRAVAANTISRQVSRKVCFLVVPNLLMAPRESDVSVHWFSLLDEVLGLGSYLGA